MKLSVVINTKNAAKTLEKTLKSVSDFADEVVVVDMESSDKTLKIAKKYKARIFKHKDLGYVEPARNFAISKAKGSWIFILDADEELDDEIKRVAKSIVSDEVGEAFKADCYYIPRKNLIFNKWIKHTGWWPDYQLRFFKKGHVEWLDEIHSFPITQGVVKQLPAKEELAILHHNYEAVSDFITRLNRYSEIQAKEIIKSDGAKHDIFDSFSGEFLSRLFAQDGIRDGAHGLSLSLLQAMNEAVIQMKVGFEKKEDDFDSRNLIFSLRKFQKDLNYWLADYELLHSSGFKKIYWRLRRKLKL
ncbi:MAG: glycosyltransferase family 2 protein [Patescibacteria group bacterium]